MKNQKNLIRVLSVFTALCIVLFSYAILFLTRVTALEGSEAQNTEKVSLLLASDLSCVEGCLTKLLSSPSPELNVVLARELAVFSGRAYQGAVQLGANLSAELYFSDLLQVADSSFNKCLYGGVLSEGDLSMLFSLLLRTRTILDDYHAGSFSAFAYTSVFDAEGEAVYLAGLDEVDNETARKNASVVMKIMPEHISIVSESVGALASYECTGFPDGQTTSLCITKRGGYLYTLRRSAVPAASVISVDEAKNIAAHRLLEYGYRNMVPKYWEVDSHTLYLTMLPFEEGIGLYNDAVTLSVSLEDGSILSLDAGAYLLHHGVRNFSDPAFSGEEALAKASLLGTPLLEKPCLVAVVGPEGREVLAYELLYRGELSVPVQIYVDAVSARVFDMVIVDVNDGNRRLVS